MRSTTLEGSKIVKRAVKPVFPISVLTCDNRGDTTVSTACYGAPLRWPTNRTQAPRRHAGKRRELSTRSHKLLSHRDFVVEPAEGEPSTTEALAGRWSKRILSLAYDGLVDLFPVKKAGTQLAMSSIDRTSRHLNRHKMLALWLPVVSGAVPVVAAVVLGLCGHDDVAQTVATTSVVTAPMAIAARKR